MRRKAIGDEAAHHVVEPAAPLEVVREHVVRAQRHRLRKVAERVEGRDERGQQVVVRAAQFDRQAGAELLHQVVGARQLVVGGDAGGHEGGEVRAREASRVSVDRLARLQPGGHDGVGARVSGDHLAHRHDLGDACRVGPCEEGGDVRRFEIGARPARNRAPRARRTGPGRACAEAKRRPRPARSPCRPGRGRWRTRAGPRRSSSHRAAGPRARRSGASPSSSRHACAHR